MSINFTSSLIEAMNASYAEGTLVRTLGFYSPGDGGAAVYMVSQNLPDADERISTTVAGVTFTYGDGKFYKTNSTVFELIPQGNKVYAEQFGVMPGLEADASNNTLLINRAVVFSSEKGYKLEFGRKNSYYFDLYEHPTNTDKNELGIIVKSNLFIDGNGATLCVHDNVPSECHFFNMSNNLDSQKNVVVSNLTVIGRTTAEENFGDQAFHVCIDGFTLRNVKIKNFNFGVHTYSRGAAAYEVPEIPNKNWLIDNCTINDTVTGLMLSEIDGLTVKDSKISCRPDCSDLDHCIYMSSNCLNVRVTNTILCDVSGDAIHKSFAAKPDVDRADISKNHFYTDLSIHNADSALDIGIISQNVMCDNVFATEVEVVLQLSGADNCIVSNSNFSQTRTSDEMQAFIYAENACNCWMQNSYVYYVGKHRTTDTPNEYVKDMYADKKHRRMFTGTDFKVNNFVIKLTGCSMISEYPGNNYYFNAHMNVIGDETVQAAVTEYWDNCTVNLNTGDNLFRMQCTSDIHTGITIRNCYLRNDFTYNKSKALFKLDCVNKICNCCTSDDCVWEIRNKRFPWIHIENVVFDNAGYWGSSSWAHIMAIHKPNETYTFSLNDAVKISNSYATNCYKISNGQKTTMGNLMA